MRNQEPVVVVGTGAAGHAAASRLRKEGVEGRVVLVHGESPAPYNRTLVDKALLPGLLTAEQVALPALEGVEMVAGRAVALDAEEHLVQLADGRTLPYSALVVTTGATPRASGLEHQGGVKRIVRMHTAADADWLLALLTPVAGRTVTILGAGFIGSEVASWLVDAGADVHMVSRSELPMAHALGTAVARSLALLHHDKVRTHFGRRVVALTEQAGRVTVRLDDGHAVVSDVVVVAHGTAPAAAWTGGGDAGLKVDDRLRAADLPDVYAAGAVAVHEDRFGMQYRIDHWDAAAAQGELAALTLMHDRFGIPDPGPYLPDTGFTLSVYRTFVGGFGARVPGSIERHHHLDGGGIVTTFETPTGDLIAATSIGAARELLAARQGLQRP
jgi:NADPH-dependent 2,4-dienoyl-CoA reductase/sulfur reductase-like enzyme